MSHVERALRLCEVLRSSSKASDPHVLMHEVREFLESVPLEVHAVDWLGVVGLLGQLIAGVLDGALGDAGVNEQVRSDLAAHRLAFLSLTDSIRHQLVTPRRDSEYRAPHVRRAVAVIDRNLSNPALRLPAVARAVGLSPSHLSRLLRQTTGLGFTHYLQTHRVARAADLLLQSSLSVKEVAARVGYQTATTFGRDFKRHHGVTPVEYRRSRLRCDLERDPPDLRWSAAHSPRTDPAEQGL